MEKHCASEEGNEKKSHGNKEVGKSETEDREEQVNASTSLQS